jgi:hypothetical protein
MMADFTEEELEKLIQLAMDEGRPNLLKYYQGLLDNLRSEKAT